MYIFDVRVHDVLLLLLLFYYTLPTAAMILVYAHRYARARVFSRRASLRRKNDVREKIDKRLIRPIRTIFTWIKYKVCHPYSSRRLSGDALLSCSTILINFLEKRPAQRACTLLYEYV